VIETVFVADTNDTPQPRPKKTEDASVSEVFDYVKAYALQETVGPLKGAGRWLGYGVAAALTLGLGLMFLLIGLLRVLQTEWDRSGTGSLSWLAYLVTFIVTVILLTLTILRIKKSTLNNEPK
jgi:hypothetical protein